MELTLTITMPAFFVGYRGTVYKVASGTNSEREMWKGCNYGRHAEVEAMLRLPPPTKKMRLKWINLIVIRVDKSGALKNSRPCIKCIEHLSNMKSYKLKYVFYSDDTGSIVKQKFSQLVQDENKHISRRFKETYKTS